MATEFVPLYPEETEEAVSARWAEWANEGLSPGDDGYVDTQPMSFWWLATRAGVREAARMYDLMGTEVVAAAFPQWAWGEYLDDHAEREGLTRNGEVKATGDLQFAGPVGTVIPAGQVAFVPGTESTDPIEFETLSARTIPAAATAPTGLATTAQPGGSLAASTLYRYVVTAVDGAGETPVSAEVNRTTSADATARAVGLTWTPVTSATSYRVYRKTGATGPPYDLLAEVVGPSFADFGTAAPNTAVHPPTANTTGGKVIAPARALEGGAAGNVGTGAITGTQPPVTDTTVTNLLPMLGGAETEGDEPLRERVVGSFEDEGGANNTFYKKIALDYPGVGRVTILPLWNGANTIKVVLSTADGQPVSAAIVNGLQAELDPVPGGGYGLAPTGSAVTVATAALLVVNVTAVIEFDLGYSVDGDGGTAATRSLISGALQSYLRTVPSGGEVVQRQAIGAVARIPGVHDLSLTLSGAGGNGNVAVGSNPAQVPVLGTLTLSAGAI
jgi:uncharacterized phage protein gp47/JayE